MGILCLDNFHIFIDILIYQDIETVTSRPDSFKQETGNSLNWLEKLTRKCQVKGLMELCTVSALIRLSDDANCASVGFSHINNKFVLDQFSESQGKLFWVNVNIKIGLYINRFLSTWSLIYIIRSQEKI